MGCKVVNNKIIGRNKLGNIWQKIINENILGAKTVENFDHMMILKIYDEASLVNNN